MTAKTKNFGFYIGYVLFLIGQLLGHTMMPISAQLRYVIIGVGVAFIFLQFLISLTQNQIIRKKQFRFSKMGIFFVLLLVISCISAIRSQEPIIILDFLFILAAKDINFDKILRIFIVTASTLLIITIISNALGLIGTAYFERGAIVRHTFGYRFPTDFVQLIVYILLADLVLCIEHNKPVFIRIGLYLFLGVFTLVYSDARLGSGTIFLLVPAILFLKYLPNIASSKIIYIFEKYIFLFCTLFAVWLMNKFNSSSSNLMAIIDEITSYRLTNTDMGIKFFGYTVWGQQIYNTIDQYFKGWFYIDSSYYVFFLQYGIGLLILVEIGYIYSMKRCIELRNYIIPFVCLFIALDSLIDQQFYLLEYNVFLLIPLASLSLKSNKDIKEVV